MSGLPTFFQKLFSSYGNAPKIKESVTLPAQASQNGKFLKTDGTNTSWDSIPEYADATTSAHGLMSASDKTKLDGIGEGANVQSVNGQTGAVTIPTSTGTVSLVSEETGITISKSSSVKRTITGLTPYKPVYIYANRSSGSGIIEIQTSYGDSFTSGLIAGGILTGGKYVFIYDADHSNFCVGVTNSSTISFNLKNTSASYSATGSFSIYQ